MSIEKQFLKILVQFTQKELSFDDLYQEFYFNFMNNCPELEFFAEDFFGVICEKMDYTLESRNVDDEDRKYGWVNIDEFRLWLINYLNENHAKLNF